MSIENEKRWAWAWHYVEGDKNRDIRVIVKAKQLFELGESVSTDEVDKLISLTTNEAGWPSDSWKSHQNFAVSVNAGFAIRWFIVAGNYNLEDEGYTIKLINVYHNTKDETRNFFGENNLTLSGNGKAMTSTILSGLKKSDNFDSFSINFSITHKINGKDVKRTFICDPKLKIRN
jgi:hypothetical protein